MNNIISFSLWGNNPKYTIGAIRNAQLAKQFYPNYVCRFYTDILVPQGIIFELEDLGCEIVPMNCVGNNFGMFWRMNAINDADIVLIRDADSRISQREVECVNEFLNSNKLYHTIFDHPFHLPFPVLPGLMCFKRTTIDFKTLVSQYGGEDLYGTDYRFYWHIFDLIKDDLFIHDYSGKKGKKIDCQRDENGVYFIGEVFDENDFPNSQHRQSLKQAIK